MMDQTQARVLEVCEQIAKLATAGAQIVAELRKPRDEERVPAKVEVAHGGDDR